MNKKKSTVMKEVNKQGETIISLHGTVRSVHIYDQLMNVLFGYMVEERKKSRKKAPIISLKEVTWIYPSAATLILCCCRVLKDYYGKPIRFIHPLSESVKRYLFYSFFNSIGKGYVDKSSRVDENSILLDFDSINAQIFQGEDNSENYMELFRARPDYYTAADPEDFKFQVEVGCSEYVKHSVFTRILKKKLGDTDELSNCQEVLTELMCNSIIYSCSDLLVNVQMISASRYHFTLCDTGIGFLESLKRKDGKPIENEQDIYNLLEARERLKNRPNNDKSLFDFYAFFTAIKHPGTELRSNLKKLIQIITREKGTIKIHMSHTLLCFYGSDDFYYKNEDVYLWMNHIYETASLDYVRSPLRIFSNSLKGVHIEVLFEDGKEVQYA